MPLVVGTARGTGSPNGVFAAAGLAEKITLERADIRDESRILEIFAAHKPQVVTSVPQVKAITTDSRMAETIPMAREVLM